MATLDEIAPHKADRALIIGGTRSGKSTLMDHLIRHGVKTRPGVQYLLLDSKPRYRCEAERYGPQNRMVRDASKHYKDWEAGPTIPGSLRLDLNAENPLERHFRPDDPFRVAIAQTEKPSERGRLLEIADDWYNIRQRKSDRVLAIDELLDYYHRNSLSIHSSRDVPLKVVRAGGERGFGALYGAQRPKRVAATNYRRTLNSVPIPSPVCPGYSLSVGYGCPDRNSATGRRARRLCISRNPNPAGR